MKEFYKLIDAMKQKMNFSDLDDEAKKRTIVGDILATLTQFEQYMQETCTRARKEGIIEDVEQQKASVKKKIPDYLNAIKTKFEELKNNFKSLHAQYKSSAADINNELTIHFEERVSKHFEEEARLSDLRKQTNGGTVKDKQGFIAASLRAQTPPIALHGTRTFHFLNPKDSSNSTSHEQNKPPKRRGQDRPQVGPSTFAPPSAIHTQPVSSNSTASISDPLLDNKETDDTSCCSCFRF